MASPVAFVAVAPAAADGAAADGVDDDEQGEKGEVEDGEGPPLRLEVREDAGLAGIAPETECLRLVAPPLAVAVVGEDGGLPGLATTPRRRVAAPRLHTCRQMGSPHRSYRRIEKKKWQRRRRRKRRKRMRRRIEKKKKKKKNKG